MKTTTRIELDVDAVRHLIRSCQRASDFKAAADDLLKIRLMFVRGEMLARLAATAEDWLVLLRGCAVADGAQRGGIEAEVSEFRSWALEELQALRALSGVEATLDE